MANMEYATVYRRKELFSIDNVPMNCTVPINSMREAILKGREVVGLQEKPLDMQEVPRQTVGREVVGLQEKPMDMQEVPRQTVSGSS